MVTFVARIQKHKVLSVVVFLVALSLLVMTVTGTLSYPYIMADRQVQSVRRCVFGDPVFETPLYGFRFTVSPDLCILPHRIFPADGSIQVVPKAFYSVFMEYAKGTIVEVSKGTYLFEQRKDGRTISVVMTALKQGGFLDGATTDVVMNAHGIPFTVVHGAKGINSSLRFNWAFAMNSRDDILLSVLARDTGEPATFQALLDGVELLP